LQVLDFDFEKFCSVFLSNLNSKNYLVCEKCFRGQSQHLLTLVLSSISKIPLSLQVLDFDFEKFCSVSLSNLNVYGCLVCGKYFQGQSQTSPYSSPLFDFPR
jgi:protein-arginine kinase activator protein McsA